MLGIVILGVFVGLVAAIVSVAAGASLWIGFLVYVLAGVAAILLVVALEFVVKPRPDPREDEPDSHGAATTPRPLAERRAGAWTVLARSRDPRDN